MRPPSFEARAELERSARGAGLDANLRGGRGRKGPHEERAAGERRGASADQQAVDDPASRLELAVEPRPGPVVGAQRARRSRREC